MCIKNRMFLFLVCIKLTQRLSCMAAHIRLTTFTIPLSKIARKVTLSFQILMTMAIGHTCVTVIMMGNDMSVIRKLNVTKRDDLSVYRYREGGILLIVQKSPNIAIGRQLVANGVTISERVLIPRLRIVWWLIGCFCSWKYLFRFYYEDKYLRGVSVVSNDIIFIVKQVRFTWQ